MPLNEQIFNAGIVGAGGAGFPAHVKAGSKVEFMLANGAECEPLIHKDFELMVHFADDIVFGMDKMMASVSASQGFFGIKSKNADAIEAVSKRLKGTRISIAELGDFYPSGDEYELVYSATKRLIPAAGIPLDVGCVVNNVETLYNISRGIQGLPVTDKFLCVTGIVKKPSSFFAPLGITFRELIKHAGGAKQDDFAIFVGGVMMGRLTFDLDEPVTKTTAGLILLPKEHYLVKRRNKPVKDWLRIGKSACDQCSYCTEFCPRYLLGYDVQPHKVMRSLVFTQTGAPVWNRMAELCCSCGLCTLYSCPEELYPKEACDNSKKEMKELGEKYVQSAPVKVHPMKEGRRVPLKQLIKKLNLQEYETHTPYNDEVLTPDSVKILLKQHIGQSAVSVVSKGARVKKGELIADIPTGKLGAKIHASIDGAVEEVNESFIKIKKI
jgi:Na+-translocating ferredoxin:NAD+ oxidoreductase RnfC subunit